MNFKEHVKTYRLGKLKDIEELDKIFNACEE